MTPDARITHWLYAAMFAAALAGCAASGAHAPITDLRSGDTKHAAVTTTPDHAPAAKPDKKALEPGPETYIVQKGDTLYGIAFSHDLDYHDLAALNNIQNPGQIQAGQELRLPAPAPAVEKPAPVVTAPATLKPVPPPEIVLKDEPRAIMLPYSEQAVAEIGKLPEIKPAPPVKAAPAPAPAASAQTPAQTATPAAAPETVPETVPEAVAAEEAVEWSMPANGRVVAGFSEADNRKGIDIAGNLGQAVVASAPGKVVYSGSGLRGYGKLVIIKHNNTYLSAYAHNNVILVKEGQTVTRGQKIAEMGKTDADQVMLHFEIRKLGKPVDPAKYLPLPKS